MWETGFDRAGEASRQVKPAISHTTQKLPVSVTEVSHVLHFHSPSVLTAMSRLLEIECCRLPRAADHGWCIPFARGARARQLMHLQVKSGKIRSVEKKTITFAGSSKWQTTRSLATPVCIKDRSAALLHGSCNHTPSRFSPSRCLTTIK